MSKGSAVAKGGQGVFKLLTLISLLSPLLFFIAVFGTRLKVWGVSFGFEVLTMQVALALAWVGGAAALLALGLALGQRRMKSVWLYVVTCVVVAGVSLAVFQVQARAYGVAGGTDVTTDAAEPVGFSRQVMGQRRGLPNQPEVCEGLVTVSRQVAPITAIEAMRQAGFTPMGSAAFRADGYRESFWFGQVHHVAIRIRPGQTDVRVGARYPVKDGDQACQLAKAVVAGLQPN